MKMKSVVATLALAATVCVPGAMYASPVTAVKSPVHAMFGKPHMVNLNLRNDSKETITVKAGDKEMTIEPGKQTALKLNEGDKIVAVSAGANHAAGDVLVVASNTLNDATIGVK